MERSTNRRSRTRTGCLRCRQRKIRCDETKPACQRCTRINADCPGYEERTRIFGLRVDECFTSEFDKICFASFTSQGVQDLASFRPSSREFWMVIVPQMADIHQTVRHASVALAVLQEPAIRPDISKDQDIRAVAYFHFNKAIRGFVDSGTSFGTIHKLTCCLLFNELMKILETIPAGAEHVKAARSILEEHEVAVAAGEAEFEPIIVSTFAPMILRCTMDALTYLDGFKIEENVFKQAEDHLLRTPSTLNSLGEAVEVMDILLKYAIVFHRGKSQSSNEKLNKALDEFGQLLEAAPNPDLQQQLQTLKPHLQIAGYLVKSRELDIQLFKEIVELSKSSSPGNWGPVLGNIPPLLFIAMRCSDVTMRDHAVGLLHNLKTSEGAFTSCMATRLATGKDAGFIKVSGDLPESTTLDFTQTNSPLQEQQDVGGLDNVQRRVIQAYGYSGILSLTSNIDCDCTTQTNTAKP